MIINILQESYSLFFDKMFVVLTILQIYKKVAEFAAFMQGLALSFALILLEVVLFPEFLLTLRCLRSEVSLPARTENDVPAPEAP